MSGDGFIVTGIYGLWGLLFGFALSVPVGPVNILCLRRALLGRARDGFYIGLGAAAADAIYAALAAFGLRTIFAFIESYDMYLKIGGGVVMAAFAVHIWRSTPHIVPEKAAEKTSEKAQAKAWGNAPEKDKGLKTANVTQGIAASFFLTITNPGIFFGFLALYALAGLGDFSAGATPAFVSALSMVLGVFLGASVWWGVLAIGAKSFRSKINDRMLEKINFASAIAIGLFAVGAIVSVAISL